MKWVTDRTGRFPERPHYDPDELDAECEEIITSFLGRRHRHVEFPATTDDLTVLIETAVDDLDLYADLSGEEGDVEGVTEFRPGKRPRVRIAGALSNAQNMENRLRTTLTHEFGHVHLHGFLYELPGVTGPLLFPVPAKAQVNKCKREAIVGARQSDWMEWQAGFACGALLMPATFLRRQVRAFAERHSLAPGKVDVGAPEAAAMIERIAGAFRVSRDAARVRLLQRGYLADAGTASQSLFRTA